MKGIQDEAGDTNNEPCYNQQNQQVSAINSNEENNDIKHSSNDNVCTKNTAINSLRHPVYGSYNDMQACAGNPDPYCFQSHSPRNDDEDGCFDNEESKHQSQQRNKFLTLTHHSHLDQIDDMSSKQSSGRERTRSLSERFAEMPVSDSIVKSSTRSCSDTCLSSGDSSEAHLYHHTHRLINANYKDKNSKNNNEYDNDNDNNGNGIHPSDNNVYQQHHHYHQHEKTYLQVPDFGFFHHRRNSPERFIGNKNEAQHQQFESGLRINSMFANRFHHEDSGFNTTSSRSMSSSWPAIKLENDASSLSPSPSSPHLRDSPYSLSPSSPMTLSPYSPMTMDTSSMSDGQEKESSRLMERSKCASDSSLYLPGASPSSPVHPSMMPGLKEIVSSLQCRWMACNVTFRSQKALAQHVNDEHVRVERPDMDFRCQWQGCTRRGKGFNARYKMLIHIRTHTNEKPHKCSVCDKCFSRLENLKIHMRSHTGEKPYVCTFPGCNKAYSNSSDRFKHVRTHQEEKPYKCKMPGCPKQYTDPSSLRKHVRTHGHSFGESSSSNNAQPGLVQRSVSYPTAKERPLSTMKNSPSSVSVTEANRRFSVDVSSDDFTHQSLIRDADNQWTAVNAPGRHHLGDIQGNIDLYKSLEFGSGIQRFSSVENCLLYRDHNQQNSFVFDTDIRKSLGARLPDSNDHLEDISNNTIIERENNFREISPNCSQTLEKIGATMIDQYNNNSSKSPLPIPSIVVEEVHHKPYSSSLEAEIRKSVISSTSQLYSTIDSLPYDKRRRHSHGSIHTMGSSLDQGIKRKFEESGEKESSSSSSANGRSIGNVKSLSLDVPDENARPRSMPSTSTSPSLIAKHWKKRKIHDEEMLQLKRKEEDEKQREHEENVPSSSLQHQELHSQQLSQEKNQQQQKEQEQGDNSMDSNSMEVSDKECLDTNDEHIHAANPTSSSAASTSSIALSEREKTPTSSTPSSSASLSPYYSKLLPSAFHPVNTSSSSLTSLDNNSTIHHSASSPNQNNENLISLIYHPALYTHRITHHPEHHIQWSSTNDYHHHLHHSIPLSEFQSSNLLYPAYAINHDLYNNTSDNNDCNNSSSRTSTLFPESLKPQHPSAPHFQTSLFQKSVIPWPLTSHNLSAIMELSAFSPHTILSSSFSHTQGLNPHSTDSVMDLSMYHQYHQHRPSFRT